MACNASTVTFLTVAPFFCKFNEHFNSLNVFICLDNRRPKDWRPKHHRPKTIDYFSTMKTFLIGFMGSGKSTAGKALAAEKGVPFIDSDSWIETQTGKTIPQIFSEEGEAHFRSLEKAFVAQLDNKPAVVACGGGLPCFNNLANELKRLGEVIYLRANPSTLILNLEKDQTERPLLKGLDTKELEQTIAAKLTEREPFYLQADKYIQTDNKTIKQVVEEILAL